MSDYRNTKYCPDLDKIEARKQEVEAIIRNDHPRARDMHRYVSKNGSVYKTAFWEAYNKKCAYCGASNILVSKRDFQVDHFFYRKSSRFPKKENAGKMDNLVLACPLCNYSKGDFNISDELALKVHPDKNEITKHFVRDKNFKICVVDPTDSSVNSFYERLRLGDELRRIDYLIMSMNGLFDVLKSYPHMSKVRAIIGENVMELLKKRNSL